MSTGLLALLLAIIVAACGGSAGGDGDRPDASAAPPSVAESGDLVAWAFMDSPPGEWRGGAMSRDELPPEALATLELVVSDGPFPYRQDGSTFQNREGFLPERDLGHYAEYTVETPGSPDRGARRLVIGGGAAVYYTDDHYASFRFVTP